MILLSLMADNFFEFNDFCINFTYKKKPVKTTLDNEYLSYCPTFRYKKFVMLMGANASGKTTFGLLLRGIVNFIAFREYAHIANCVKDNKKEAKLTIDFIDEAKRMYRLDLMIDPIKKSEYESNNIHVNVRYVDIVGNDNYEKCLKRIEKQEINITSNYIKELEKVNKITWMFKFAENDSISGETNNLRKNSFIETLDRTLKVLDPRILEVKKVANSKDTYLIKYGNREVLLSDGNIANNTLSSGTKEGIGIAHLVTSIKSGLYRFYFCDEKFSHVHTDTEKAFISLMTDCLNKDNQLIMTSHNTEILEMRLPKHSFAFLKRDSNKNVSCIYASDYLKRNTDSIKCAVDNDVFGTSPNVDDIYKLGDI